MPKPKKVVKRTVSKATSRTGVRYQEERWTHRLRGRHHHLLRES